MEWTLERGEQATGIPPTVIREFAHAYAKADRAEICWTLGITEHHNAVDNVLALINLGLLCGHVGRYGSGLNPLRGQNNVQGGGDMGAIPKQAAGVPGHREGPGGLRSLRGGLRGRRHPEVREEPDADVRGDGARGVERALRDRREPGELRGRRRPCEQALGNLDTLIVQDLFMTKTARWRTSCCRRRTPPRIGGQRHEQRASGPARPEGARAAGEREGRHLDHRAAREATRFRLARSRRAGVGRAPARLADARRDDERAPGRGGGDPVALLGRGAPRDEVPPRSAVGGGTRQARAEGAVQRDPVRAPVDELTEEFPLRLTTGRRLDSYNTGVQTGGYTSPLRRGETIDMSPRTPLGSGSRKVRWSASVGVVRSMFPHGSIAAYVPGSCS